MENGQFFVYRIKCAEVEDWNPHVKPIKVISGGLIVENKVLR